MNKNKKPHGGLRLGAGRKLNSGIYGEPTKVIRVPESKVVDINSEYFLIVDHRGKQVWKDWSFKEN